MNSFLQLTAFTISIYWTSTQNMARHLFQRISGLVWLYMSENVKAKRQRNKRKGITMKIICNYLIDHLCSSANQYAVWCMHKGLFNISCRLWLHAVWLKYNCIEHQFMRTEREIVRQGRDICWTTASTCTSQLSKFDRWQWNRVIPETISVSQNTINFEAQWLMLHIVF